MSTFKLRGGTDFGFIDRSCFKSSPKYTYTQNKKCIHKMSEG